MSQGIQTIGHKRHFEISEPTSRKGPEEGMIKFKSCPKCSQGDLMLNQDVYGWYLQCLQCAHIVEMVAPPAKEKLPTQPVAVGQTAE